MKSPSFKFHRKLQSKDFTKWGVLITTLMGGFMVILNNSLMNVALPFFMNLYTISAVEGQWVVTAFALSMAIVMPLTNYLGKSYGHKKTFILGTFIFLIGSFFGSLAWNFEIIILFRVLQGFGGGLIMPLAMVLIFENFPKNQRGLAMGIWGISAMTAPTFGPIIGGVILEYFTWQILFLINIPIALIVIGAGVYFLEKDKEPTVISFDWLGFIFIACGILATVIGVDSLQTSPGELWVFVVILIGIVSLTLFIRQELRVKEPLLNIRILKSVVFSGSLIIVTLGVTAMFSVLLLVPILNQDIYNLSALYTGILLLPQALSMGIAMTVGGRMLDKKGPYIVFMWGIIITTLSTFAIAFTVGSISPIWLGILLFCHGFGCGMINTPASTAGLNALKDVNIPAGAALNNIARQLMKVISIILLSIFFEMRRGYYSTNNDWVISGERAVQDSYILVGIILIASIPFIHSLRKRW